MCHSRTCNSTTFGSFFCTKGQSILLTSQSTQCQSVHLHLDEGTRRQQTFSLSAKRNVVILLIISILSLSLGIYDTDAPTFTQDYVVETRQRNTISFRLVFIPLSQRTGGNAEFLNKWKMLRFPIAPEE